MKYDNFDLWSQEDFIEAGKEVWHWVAKETICRQKIVSPYDFFQGTQNTT